MPVALPAGGAGRARASAVLEIKGAIEPVLDAAGPVQRLRCLLGQQRQLVRRQRGDFADRQPRNVLEW